MKSSRAAVAPLLTVLAVLLAGCQSSRTTAPPPDTSPPAAIKSLAKVDNHPLWQLRYEGGYDRMRGVDPVPSDSGFGCSLFVANGDRTDPLFARNFDWQHGPALLLFTDPPDGHASVSMVDTTYLGLRDAGDFTTDKGRRGLLQAPLLPFDGMNEKGLAVGLAAVDKAKGPSGRTEVGSLRILRIVLDRAASVGEALALFERYSIDFEGGPPLHYLIADAQGVSAVVEFVGGKVVAAERGKRDWNAAVNFTFAETPVAQRLEDRRYGAASARLTRAGGTLDTKGALGLLREVAQPHTQWSVLYGLKSGKVSVVTGQRWGTVHTFQLRMPPRAP